MSHGRWTPAISNAIHAVQLQIAWRGLELLKVGGLMCYSTCSMNPIEVRPPPFSRVVSREKRGDDDPSFQSSLP
jgi:hypothetical protein